MTCAYCMKRGKMTREHILPKFIYNYQYQFSGMTGWNDAAGQMLKSEQVIKDVCNDCNSGELSTLDAYGKSFLGANGLLAQNFEKTAVELKYDYHQLLRWMLKISFNSARRTGNQSDIFEGLQSYILGRSHLPKNKAVMMALLLSGVDLTNNPIGAKLGKDYVSSTGIWNPFLVRISYMGDVDPSLSKLKVRVNIFGPLVTFLMIFDDDVPDEYVQRGKQAMLKKFHNAKILLKTCRKRKLKQSTITWHKMYEVQLSLQNVFTKSM